MSASLAGTTLAHWSGEASGSQRIQTAAKLLSWFDIWGFFPCPAGQMDRAFFVSWKVWLLLGKVSIGHCRSRSTPLCSWPRTACPSDTPVLKSLHHSVKALGGGARRRVWRAEGRPGKSAGSAVSQSFNSHRDSDWFLLCAGRCAEVLP